MKKLGGTKSWVVAVGVTLLLAFLVVPALSGAASASSAPRADPAAAHHLSWAYCGSSQSNHTVTFGNVTLSWNASFAMCTIFHVTNTTPGVQMLELNRTLGVNISATFSNPGRTAEYHYLAVEMDAAFANVTNGSTVYVADQPVPALGLLNASTFDQSSLEQSMNATVNGSTAGGSLSVHGMSNASVAFAPSLGLIPRTLTGVTHWNSTSVATASAAWQVNWTWSHTTFTGTTSSASSSHAGNLSGTFPVRLNGFQVSAHSRSFADHMNRVGVILGVQGPFDLRDGFVLVPHAFDMFGGAGQAFAANSMGSATVASGETLYFSEGLGGLELTAAASSFSADDSLVDQGGFGPSGLSPALGTGMNPTGTVLAQPVSVAQAEAESNQIAGFGGFGVASHTIGGALPLGLIAVAAVVVVLGLVGWRSYARRRASPRTSDRRLGYGSNGVPPAVLAPPPVPGPTAPVEGPESVSGPNRPL